MGSTTNKHKNINNSLIPKLNIPDTIWDKDNGMLYWDIIKLARNEGVIDYKTLLPMKVTVLDSLASSKKLLSDSDRQVLDRIIRDLNNRYFYENSPGNESDYTNFLAKVNLKLNDKLGLIYYKRINPNEDRLVYRISKPAIDKLTGKFETIIQLKSCIGHEYRLNPNGPIIVRFSDIEVEDYFDEININDIYNPSLTELDW